LSDVKPKTAKASGCLSWGLRFVAIVGATLPLYFIAVWSIGSSYLNSASPEEQGWMVVFFPILFIPPLLPWLSIAVPAAFALAFRHVPTLPLATLASLASSRWAVEEFFVPRATEFDTDRMTSYIGTINVTTFVIGVWVIAMCARFAIGFSFKKGSMR
jgi:hypothetical protein